MHHSSVAQQCVVIDAPVARVWDALVNPEIIRKYLWGTEATSEWKAGSPITYRGEWRGRSYEDRGEILELEPELLLVTSYWSSRTGLPDRPGN